MWCHGKVHAWKIRDRHKLHFNLFFKFNNTNTTHQNLALGFMRALVWEFFIGLKRRCIKRPKCTNGELLTSIKTFLDEKFIDIHVQKIKYLNVKLLNLSLLCLMQVKKKISPTKNEIFIIFEKKLLELQLLWEISLDSSILGMLDLLEGSIGPNVRGCRVTFWYWNACSK